VFDIYTHELLILHFLYIYLHTIPAMPKYFSRHPVCAESSIVIGHILQTCKNTICK